MSFFEVNLPAKGLGEVKGVGAKFDRFLSEIELTPSQKQEAQKRHTSLRAKLAEEFPTSSTFLVGSYGRNTAIRPPADLDIMLVLPRAFYDRYSGFDYLFKNGQSAFLQEIKRRIQKHYPATDIRADGQVVVIRFSGSFSVEVVPCFANLYSGTYEIADTNDGGSWRTVNPVSESKALTDSNTRTNGNTIRLIKMLKCWKRTCNVPLKSFYLEVMAMSFLSSYEYKDKSSIYYDWMVRDFFKWAKDSFPYWYTDIYHPSTAETIHLGSEWVSKAESAYGRALKAIEYEADGMPYNAKSEWQKIFGTDYSG